MPLLAPAEGVQDNPANFDSSSSDGDEDDDSDLPSLMSDDNGEIPDLPLREGHVWSYLRFLHGTGKSPTKATSFVEAICFLHITVHADGAEETLASLRVKGFAAQMLATEKPWQPADRLTVSQVRTLHDGLNDANLNIIDRISWRFFQQRTNNLICVSTMNQIVNHCPRY